MTLPTPTLDHVVVNVRDRIDEGQALYERLGFHLTPRGYHTLGSMNHLAIFGTDYLELIAAPADSARTDVLHWPAGLNGIVFGTEDSAGVHDALIKAGVFVAEPGEFSRPVELDDGPHDAVFRTVRLPNEVSPAGRLYFCHHFTRELVWRDEWRHHPNGVVGVAAAIVVADLPETLGALFRTMFGPETVAAIRGGVRLAMGMSSTEVVTPSEAALRYGRALPEADERHERMAVLSLRTVSVEKTARALEWGKIPFERPDADRVLVSAGETMGVTLEFRA